jgi:hypothetical protein
MSSVITHGRRARIALPSLAGGLLLLRLARR